MLKPWQTRISIQNERTNERAHERTDERPKNKRKSERTTNKRPDNERTNAWTGERRANEQTKKLKEITRLPQKLLWRPNHDIFEASYCMLCLKDELKKQTQMEWTQSKMKWTSWKRWGWYFLYITWYITCQDKSPLLTGLKYFKLKTLEITLRVFCSNFSKSGYFSTRFISDLMTVTSFLPFHFLTQVTHDSTTVKVWRKYSYTMQ